MATAAPTAAPPALPEKPLLPLKEFLPFLTDGNAYLVLATLEFEDVKDVIDRCTKACLKEENQKAMTEIYENKEWDGPRKGQKAEMLFSKLYLQALKQRGFKAGVDCKKCIREFHDYKFSDHFTQDEKDTIDSMLKVRTARQCRETWVCHH